MQGTSKTYMILQNIEIYLAQVTISQTQFETL